MKANSVNLTNLAFKEDEHFTYADYKEWELKPGERYELINGQAFMMAGAATKHQRAQAEISRQMLNFLVGKPCSGFNPPFDVRLFYEEDESDDTVVQPDFTVICDKTKIGDEGCRGAPDLVVEILSPSNSASEMQRKMELYREAGVREYWLVDPENKTITIYHLVDGEYAPRRFPLGSAAVSEVLKGFELPVDLVFGE